MNPPGNIVDIYKSQGWNDDAAIQADISAGGWKSKVPSTGGGSSSSNAYANFDASQIPSTLDFAKNLNASEDNAFKDYLTAVTSQQSPIDAFMKMEQEAGLPLLKKASSTLSGQINDLEDTLFQVEDDVSARSRESMLTEAQRRGLVTETKRPMIESLERLGTALGRIGQQIKDAEGNILIKTQLIMESQDRALEPLKLNIQRLSDQNSRLLTGFSSDKETNLQVLLKKLDAQQQLNMAEMQQLNDLAKLSKQYELQKEAFNYGTEVVTVGGQVKLINSATGETIANLGSSSEGGSGSGNLFGQGSGPGGLSAWVVDDSSSDFSLEQYTGF